MATHSSIPAWRIRTDRAACRATVHRVAESRTQLTKHFILERWTTFSGVSNWKQSHHNQAFSTLKRDASIPVGCLQQRLPPGVVQEQASASRSHPGWPDGVLASTPSLAAIEVESWLMGARVFLSPWMDISIKLLSRSRGKPVGWREEEAPIYNCNESSKLSHTRFFSRAHSTSEDGYWTF